MEKAICTRPDLKTKNQWGDENGVKVIGPSFKEKVTITDRSIVQGQSVVRLKEYKLPNNSWWEAKHFKLY